MKRICSYYKVVFADIVNVLLFNGEEVIKESDLIDETTTSYYKISDKIKGQDRDVSKIWMDNVIHLSSFGFENETRIERICL